MLRFWDDFMWSVFKPELVSPEESSLGLFTTVPFWSDLVLPWNSFFFSLLSRRGHWEIFFCWLFVSAGDRYVFVLCLRPVSHRISHLNLYEDLVQNSPEYSSKKELQTFGQLVGNMKHKALAFYKSCSVESTRQLLSGGKDGMTAFLLPSLKHICL